MDAGYRGKGTKPAAGTRHFGKFIGKFVRGVSDKVKLIHTPPDDASNDRDRIFQMGLESYARALEGGDQRRIRGIRTAGIIVHAEAPSSGWRGRQSLQGKTINDIDQLARLAYDSFVDSDMNAVHVIYTKDNKVVSQVSFPQNYPFSKPQNMASLQESIIEQLKNTKVNDADGYYAIQNYPDSKIDSSLPEMHQAMSKTLPGYLGGLLISPGFKYGYMQLQDDIIRIQERQLPLPSAGEEFVVGYDGPYTVLNNHQELLGKPTIDDNQPLKISNDNIKAISQKIERARDTTLLIYARNGKTVAIQEIPNNLFKKSKKFNDYTKNQMDKYNADEVVAVVDKSKIHGAKSTIERSINKAKIDLKVASLDSKDLTTELINPDTLTPKVG